MDVHPQTKYGHLPSSNLTYGKCPYQTEDLCQITRGYRSVVKRGNGKSPIYSFIDLDKMSHL